MSQPILERLGESGQIGVLLLHLLDDCVKISNRSMRQVIEQHSLGLHALADRQKRAAQMRCAELVYQLDERILYPVAAISFKLPVKVLTMRIEVDGFANQTLADGNAPGADVLGPPLAQRSTGI